MSRDHDHNTVTRSERNFTGGYNHYDERGHKIGHSDPSIFGGYNHYDEKGHKTGHSDPNMFGGYTDYDAKGHKTGYSTQNFTGGYDHYDQQGHKNGSSNPNFSGGYNHDEGCYIATCVYGSYDTPEVWTLRRFRDNFLGSTIPGRMFIRLYYGTSPKLVKLFGEQKWFRKIWKGALDRFVVMLNSKGYENTSYEDVNWRKKSVKR